MCQTSRWHVQCPEANSVKVASAEMNLSSQSVPSFGWVNQRPDKRVCSLFSCPLFTSRQGEIIIIIIIIIQHHCNIVIFSQYSLIEKKWIHVIYQQILPRVRNLVFHSCICVLYVIQDKTRLFFYDKKGRVNQNIGCECRTNWKHNGTFNFCSCWCLFFTCPVLLCISFLSIFWSPCSVWLFESTFFFVQPMVTHDGDWFLSACCSLQVCSYFRIYLMPVRLHIFFIRMGTRNFHIESGWDQVAHDDVSFHKLLFHFFHYYYCVSFVLRMHNITRLLLFKITRSFRSIGY